MEEYSANAQRAKVAAGMGVGGNMFTNLIKHPAMTIVNGVPAEVIEETTAVATTQIPIEKSIFAKR